MISQSQFQPTRRWLFAAGFADLALIVASAARADDAPFVVKDMRNVDEKVVRFSVAQGTERMPNLALFGGSKEVWARVKGAATQAAAQGYPIRAILIGPTTAKPSLEIFAKGQKVSQPIDPGAIAPERLVLLLKNTKREFYG